MTIETNIRSRRELASALAEYLNTRAVYLGPPTFAYQIGDIHLSREGILSGDDLDGIFPFLEMQGIVAAQPKTIQEITGSTASGIQIPLEGYTPVNLRNLLITLYSKQWLIRKACCMPALHIPESAVNSMPTDTLESAVQLLHDLKAAGTLTGIDITYEQITFFIDGSKKLYIDEIEIGQSVPKGSESYDIARIMAYEYTDVDDIDGDGDTDEFPTGWHMTLKCICGLGDIEKHEPLSFGDTGVEIRYCGGRFGSSNGIVSIGNGYYYNAGQANNYPKDSDGNDKMYTAKPDTKITEYGARGTLYFLDKTGKWELVKVE